MYLTGSGDLTLNGGGESLSISTGDGSIRLNRSWFAMTLQHNSDVHSTAFQWNIRTPDVEEL